MLPAIIWAMFALFFLPVATAIPEEMPFPDISFVEFSQFITKNFNSTISLASVLCMLFSLTENPELLTLHTRQQNARFKGEYSVTATAWIRCLSRFIQGKLCGDGEILLKESDAGPTATSDQKIIALSIQLDAFAKLLQLNPCDKNGRVRKRLKPVSYKAIAAVHIICPDTFQCETANCNPRSLQQATKIRDIPLVTLIKGFTIYEDCPVLTGECSQCNTTYSADHERAPTKGNQTKHVKVYLNSAKYLKVGQNIWVDRLFGNAVMCGMYSFHASAAAYAEFWNNAFWEMQMGNSPKISRRQIWQTFVQESVRSIASTFRVNLELEDGLAIDQVTKQAFGILGEKGIIRAAEHHSCSECTQTYKSTSDRLSLYDPAATVGMDEDNLVPQLEINVGNVQQVGAPQIVQRSEPIQAAPNNHADVRLVVLDGIVMGPNVGFNAKYDIYIIHYNF
jgi:hypothetical protein